MISTPFPGTMCILNIGFEWFTTSHASFHVTFSLDYRICLPFLWPFPKKNVFFFFFLDICSSRETLLNLVWVSSVCRCMSIYFYLFKILFNNYIVLCNVTQILIIVIFQGLYFSISRHVQEDVGFQKRIWWWGIESHSPEDLLTYLRLFSIV